MSRLASKRKSRNITKDEADGATAGTATGAAAVTTTVVADNALDTKGTEAHEPTRSSVEDAEVLGAPISPVHTKDSGVPRTKPDLERHITNIETSSESESDNEEDRLRKREKKQKKSALLVGADMDTVNTDDDEHFVSPNEAFATPVRTRSIGDAPLTVSTTATKSSGELPNENSSTVATKSIAERVLSSPVDAPRALASPVVAPVEAARESTASSRPDVEKEKAQDSKRSRGFFSRFRNRQSKTERQPGSFSGTSGKHTAGTAAVPSAAAVTSSSDPRAASPSSFTRRRSSDDDVVAASRKSSLDLSDVSSLSSGLDEDDLQNGRTGREARAEKTKTIGVSDTDGLATTATTTAGKGVRSDDDDSDQFEEARDHFDEGLAPRPSFGGQAKSASPARETRFKEEV